MLNVICLARLIQSQSGGGQQCFGFRQGLLNHRRGQRAVEVEPNAVSSSACACINGRQNVLIAEVQGPFGSFLIACHSRTRPWMDHSDVYYLQDGWPSCVHLGKCLCFFVGQIVWISEADSATKV